MAVITCCIEEHPTWRTIQFGGVYVNLRAMARVIGIDSGYISRMLSGGRDPTRMSLGVAMQMAGALGLSLDDFIQAIYDRQLKLKTEHTRLEMFKDHLDTQADLERKRLTKRGLPAPPPIPLGRTIE